MTMAVDVLEVEGDLPNSMVERMTMILELFDRPTRRLSLEQVVARTQLPRSTTHRILRQLVHLDWLNRAPSGYTLGPRSLALGGGQSGHTDLRMAAFPWLSNLAIRTNTAVHLAVCHSADIEYVDKFGGRAALRVPSRVGGRAPAHKSSLGRAMLAWAAPRRIADLYVNGFCEAPILSPASLARLHHELHVIRTRGGVVSQMDEWPGCFDSIAIALRRSGQTVAAISITSERHQMSSGLVPQLQQTAYAIERELSSAHHGAHC